MGVSLVWFRRDLRLDDHLALDRAAQLGPVVGFFALPRVRSLGHDDDMVPSIGSAQAVFLHHALIDFADQLARLGSSLIVRPGQTGSDVARELLDVAHKLNVNEIYALAGQTPWDIDEEKMVRSVLAQSGVNLILLGSPWLAPPDLIRPKTGGTYQVFTPFWSALRQQIKPITITPPPQFTKLSGQSIPPSLPPEQWGLIPSDQGAWPHSMMMPWMVQAPKGLRLRRADEVWSEFSKHIHDYGTARDNPSLDQTSRLSPYLALGMRSSRRVVHDLLTMLANASPSAKNNIEVFYSEIGWREFARYLWWHDPKFINRDWKPRAKPWSPIDPSFSKRWRLGQTGLPMVDAGLRQLWSTGWMHNRVRMVVADFWCKHLGYDWRDAASWFWDTLVDADPASNALGWQWASGTGPDAAPYYRVFNPTRQAERFDPDASYIKKYVPELNALSPKEIFEPWVYPHGTGYPAPIKTPAQGRAHALSLA